MYFNKSILLTSIISMQIIFCMDSQPPAKKQKTENVSQKEPEKPKEEKALDSKLEKLPLEEIKDWKNAEKFQGCLVACKANLFKYKTEKGLFNGVKYAFIFSDQKNCNLCREKGYKIWFFCNDKDEKSKIVLCHEKFNLEKNSFFKVRLLTIEEIKRISNLLNSKNISLEIALYLKAVKF